MKPTLSEVDDWINVEPLTRLGIDVVAGDKHPSPYYVSNNQRQTLNSNLLGEESTKIVPCVDPRDTSKQAWILIWQHPETTSFWEWNDRDRYSGLEHFLDEIIASAKQFKLPLLVPLDKVTFSDTSNRVKNRSAPPGVDKFRAWLMTKYEFISIGESPNKRGEILCLDPEQPVIEESVPEMVSEFFDEVERRLETEADQVWFNRMKRRILATVRLTEK